MPEDQCTVSGIISLSSLSLVNKHDTWGKEPLARNQDGSWWYC